MPNVASYGGTIVIGVTVFVGVFVLGDDIIIKPCSRSLAVDMVAEEIQELNNGSIFYDGHVYSKELYWWDEESNKTFGCPCRPGMKCLRKCCQPGEVLLFSDDVHCIKVPEEVPPLQLATENLSPQFHNLTMITDAFFMVPTKFCPFDDQYFPLDPQEDENDKFTLHLNGTLTTSNLILPPKRYCLDWQKSLDDVRVLVCVIPPSPIPAAAEVKKKVYSVGMIVSTPFLLATFVVYSIIPELQNLYGKTVMCYVVCLVVAYAILLVVRHADFPQDFCAPFAYTIYFSFLASFFWLNVMCFDIWWTFGGYRSLQGSVKQRERKKFFLYSIYAWGAAILLTALCITMDNVASMSKDIVVPGFGVSSCWFADSKAKGLYFYVPMGITISCNIILFISTALKIAQHKRDTAHQLKGMDSRRHDDNKQWFNLYLKLFIVMGINWSMEIISWLYDTPAYLWYITDMGNTLQGVIIFIIFVWKEKIKRLLFKRFGCQGPKFLSRDSTRSAYPSSTSRTCTTSVPLHEKTHDKMSTLPDPLPHGKTHFEDSDGV